MLGITDELILVNSSEYNRSCQRLYNHRNVLKILSQSIKYLFIGDDTDTRCESQIFFFFW